jgi:protein TIF31
VVTLEGNKFCITGTTKTFYVNSSTGNTLDPRPSKTNFEATTLAGLLQKISPKFKKGNITWFKHFILLRFEVG